MVFLRETDFYSQDETNRWQDAIDEWLTKQEDERYKYPTEFCSEDEGGDEYIHVFEPKNEQQYDNEDIKIHAEVNSKEEVERIMIFVNNEQKGDKEGKIIDQNLNLTRGKYEIFIKAKLQNGQEIESGRMKIATGGDSL